MRKNNCVSPTASSSVSAYQFSGKVGIPMISGWRYRSGGKKDATRIYYLGKRYYRSIAEIRQLPDDPYIGRWLSVDPMADMYPSLSPYNYCANNPVIIIDPDGQDWYDLGDEHLKWREGSDPQEKPGIGNYLARLVGLGGYATSLGKELVYAKGSLDEKVNEATLEVYLESNKEGPVATIKGNTIPSDQKAYATLAEGLYSAELTNFKGNPALKINNGGEVPTVFPNPNQGGAYFATGIYFHAGHKGAESFWYLKEGILQPISKGCQTAAYGNRPAYLNFFTHFPQGWKGNYYLKRE